MNSADFTFQTVDGTKLHVSGWTIDNPKAVVQVIHGMAEYGSRYARLAQALADAGYSTYAHDHRGHGKSIAEGQPPGHMADEDSWNRIVEDAHGVNREIAKRHPNSPIIILGHSMGSFVLQQLLFEHPNDMVAACLSGSNGKPPAIATLAKVIARIERLRVGKRKPSPVLQKLTFEDYNKAFKPNRTEFDWLSRDEHEVDLYVADPLLGFAVSTQTWIDMIDALGRIANPRNIAKVPQGMPIYLFAGSEDPVGDKGKGMRNLYDAYKRAAIFDVRLKLYEGARHETLNETNRQEVTNDFIAWCDEVITAHA
ncbi:MAG: lysophospholipase [Myxococcales bacterium]|nr:lysophospholipase [Myxococcales bacterium]MDH3484616.1 lysophospholipase [Myxococcales bacterium]